MADPTISAMWVARDMAGTGLYTLWLGEKPTIDNKGYYRTADDNKLKGTLFMTIHDSKMPWTDLKMDRGECKHVFLVPEYAPKIDPKDSGEQNAVLQQDDSGGEHRSRP